MIIQVALNFVLVIISNRDIYFSEYDTIMLYGLDGRHMNNIGTMGAEEFWPRQEIVEFLHRDERLDVLAIF
jgi:hypothetical protein